MKPISLTFRVRGRQAKAKLPPLPQDLRDTLEHCITWMPAPSSHMPGLCLCDEEHFQRWLDHISDLSLSLRLRAICFLCCHLEQLQPGVLTIPSYLLQAAGIGTKAELSLLEPGCILIRAPEGSRTPADQQKEERT